jgi:proline dehydrogenase
MADNLTAALLEVFEPPDVPASWALPTAPLPVLLKYLPYGTIEQTIPYLVRRAQENKAVLQG